MLILNLVVVLIACGACGVVPGLIFGLIYKNIRGGIFAGVTGGILGTILGGLLLLVFTGILFRSDGMGGDLSHEQALVRLISSIGFLFGGAHLGAIIIGWLVARPQESRVKRLVLEGWADLKASGQKIGKGFKGFKANFLVFTGAFLLSVVLFFVLTISVGVVVFYVLSYLFDFGVAASFPYTRGELGLSLSLSLLIVGWANISLQMVRGQKPKISHFFASYLKPSIAGVAIIYVFGIVLLTLVTTHVFGFDLRNLGAFYIGLRFPFWPTLVMHLFTLVPFFALWFIADKNMSIRASISSAAEFTWGNRMQLFLFFLVSFLTLGLLFLVATVPSGLLVAIAVSRSGYPMGLVSEALRYFHLLLTWLPWFLIIPPFFISTAYFYEGITSGVPAFKDTQSGEKAEAQKMRERDQRKRSQRGKSGRRGDAELTALLRSLINKQATEAEVKEAALNVEKHVAGKEAAVKELARLVTSIVNSGKVANYGTPLAQEVICGWAKKYGESPEEPPRRSESPGG